jgi:response regulator of citrate/malate metabolism
MINVFSLVPTKRYSVVELAREIGCSRMTVNRRYKEGIYKPHFSKTGKIFFLGMDIIKAEAEL